MANVPSKGKLRILYFEIEKDCPVSRKDLEELVEKLKKKYPDRPFGPQDVENLLYQARGFMVPHPQQKGYFLRSDSSLASEFNTKAVCQTKPFDFDLNMMHEFSIKIENVTRQYQELSQRVNDKVREKEQLEQEIRRDQEKLKKLEDALESVREFFRKAA